jgi:two-component system, NtrC family, sensor histidine kinase KinB
MRLGSSLRSRIRNGTLLLVVFAVCLGAYALPRVYQLGGAIRETLYRNYVTIEAAQHMHAALHRLQVAVIEGRTAQALPDSRREFMYWINIENHNFTEVGEPALAHDIENRGQRLLGELAARPADSSHDREFAELHARLDDLIAMNQAAMFRADSRTVALGGRLTYEFGAGLVGLFLVGAALSWGLGLTLSRPLTELAQRLRGISQRNSKVRLGPQPLEELDMVAREFNQMAERLEEFEKLNVERLLYEKSKIEAIIEGLEDGIVLIDSEGVVTHINEVAAIIMGLEPRAALGSPFDDLDSNHPHYLRIRAALRELRKAEPDAQRVEVQLHVRGRDHSYVLKPVALRQRDGTPIGTLLILQDVTYLRDQDRARTNLVATLSHELRTPLTSLALSGELLCREEDRLSPRQAELARTIVEECTRMRQLTDNLLNLARGTLTSIALQRERLDLARIAQQVCDRFAFQTQEKHVSLERQIEQVPEILGDPVKLSWVLSNLIANALRYTPGGGRIGVVAHPINGTVRLEVADSGPGIPPQIRDHIFERFAQYGEGAERGSAGLGLAIVKDIVEAHGGRIFLQSSEEHGGHFIVEFPVASEV